MDWLKAASAVAIALVLMVSLAACLQAPPPPMDDGDAKKVHVTLWLR